jgi:hypothetical protein
MLKPFLPSSLARHSTVKGSFEYSASPSTIQPPFNAMPNSAFIDGAVMAGLELGT